MRSCSQGSAFGKGDCLILAAGQPTFLATRFVPFPTMGFMKCPPDTTVGPTDGGRPDCRRTDLKQPIKLPRWIDIADLRGLEFTNVPF